MSSGVGVGGRRRGGGGGRRVVPSVRNDAFLRPLTPPPTAGGPPPPPPTLNTLSPPTHHSHRPPLPPLPPLRTAQRTPVPPRSTAAASDAPTPSTTRSFEAARWVTFAAMFAGYGAFYLTRNSLAFTAPFMLEDKALGLTLSDVGTLTSILPVMYGVSKFASGVLGARTYPTVLLAGGLAATAAANAMFGAASSFPLLATAWGLNGLLQGLGAPACARILTAWYPESMRGTFWGFWTASNNVGGFAAPLLAGGAAAAFGWRAGMVAPAAVAAAVSLFVAAFMKESPESQGFPAVGGPAVKKVEPAAAATTPTPPTIKPSLIRTLLDDVLSSPAVWLLALAYFFVYVVRQGVTSWFVFYLKEKGAAAPALAVSGLELGGLLGSLSSGALSDAWLRRNTEAGSPAGNMGLRVRVVIGYSILTAACIGAFWAAPTASPALLWLLVAAVGFSLYGPQMLIGLCGAEAVPRHAVSAAQGFLGWVSYLGAANAGVPLAALVQRAGWDAYFGALAAACGVVVLLVTPLAFAPSYSQKEARRVAAAGA